MDNFLKTLRDPIWQFWGATVSVIALIVTIFLYLRQRSKRSLTYEIVTETSVLEVNAEVKNRVKILVDDKPTSDVYLLTFCFRNSGNQAIRKEDFERPINIGFTQYTEILNVEISRVKPKSLIPKLHTQAGFTITTNDLAQPEIHPPFVKVEPALLNPKDEIEIKLLVARYDKEYLLDARIVGTELSEYNPNRSIALIFQSVKTLSAILAISQVPVILQLLASQITLPYFIVGLTGILTMGSVIYILMFRSRPTIEE